MLTFKYAGLLNRSFGGERIFSAFTAVAGIFFGNQSLLELFNAGLFRPETDSEEQSDPTRQPAIVFTRFTVYERVAMLT